MHKWTGILRAGLPRAAVAVVLVRVIGVLALYGWPSVSAQSQSSDATLSDLTLSDIDIGTFAPETNSIRKALPMV